MVDNVAIIKTLFSQLEAPLFLGDHLGQGNFSVLMQPGQFVSLNLKEQDSSEDMAIQARLTNDALDTSFMYQQLPSQISRVYKDVLDHAALPHKELDRATLERIQALRQWISDNQAAYTIWRDKYYDASDAYEVEARSQIPSGSRLRRLRQKMDDAFTAFQPYQRDWNNHNGLLIQLIGEDPSALWNDFRNQLNFHTKQAPRSGTYFQTFLTPSISEWNSPNTSWGAFEKIITESDTSSYSRSTSWSAGASASWGLWSFGGGASGSSQYQHQTSDTSAVNVKFEYLRVRIDRPWLVPDIFGYKFWTWKDSYASPAAFPLISDGGNLRIDPPIRPLGVLPLLPSFLIVVRNVELSANFSHNEQTFIASQLTATASGGWGPFSISGSYSESTSENHAKASFDGTTIKIAQPQIIAFSGILLPKSPDPDQHLPWTGDQVFPPTPTSAYKKERDADLASLIADLDIANRKVQLDSISREQLASFRIIATSRAHHFVNPQKRSDVKVVVSAPEDPAGTNDVPSS